MNKNVLSIVVVLILAISCVQAEDYGITTTYPYIEYPYLNSDYGEITLNGVVLTDEFTIISFDYITNPNSKESWVSFSSLTTLEVVRPLISEPIIAWGTNSSDGFNELDFDSKYTLKSDRQYQFLLFFKRVPKGINMISIKENMEGGFYWVNVFINNTKYNNKSSHSNPYHD